MRMFIFYRSKEPMSASFECKDYSITDDGFLILENAHYVNEKGEFKTPLAHKQVAVNLDAIYYYIVD